MTLMKCPSCAGTGIVYYEYSLDEDNYPLYKKMQCPYCHGVGEVDLAEIFIVPRGMVRQEFFVNPEFTKDSQDAVRRALSREKEFFNNITS